MSIQYRAEAQRLTDIMEKKGGEKKEEQKQACTYPGVWNSSGGVEGRQQTIANLLGS